MPSVRVIWRVIGGSCGWGACNTVKEEVREDRGFAMRPLRRLGWFLRFFSGHGLGFWRWPYWSAVW